MNIAALEDPARTAPPGELPRDNLPNDFDREPTQAQLDAFRPSKKHLIVVTENLFLDFARGELSEIENATTDFQRGMSVGAMGLLSTLAIDFGSGSKVDVEFGRMRAQFDEINERKRRELA